MGLVTVYWRFGFTRITMTPRCAAVAIANALAVIWSLEGPSVRANEPSMIGQGLLSCATWTQKRDSSTTETERVERAGEEAWVAGFLSGAGEYTQGMNSLEHSDINRVLDYIDNYCKAHPDEQMVRAAMAFVASH